MKPLPKSAIVNVDENLANSLLMVTEKMPEYVNRDFYDPAKQLSVYQWFRQHCHDEFEHLLAQIKTQLAHPPYSVLIRGLKFDDNHRLLVALNRGLGCLVARPFDENTPRAQLIHHVEPQTDIDNCSKERQAVQKLSEKLHIDGADRPKPVRFVTMQCVRSDPLGGGRSRLLDHTGFRKILEQGDFELDLIKLLEQQALPWQIADYLGGGVSWRKVLTDEGICWRRYTVDAALAKENISLAPEIHQALSRVEELIQAENSYMFDFLLSPGDFLIVDNRRCLHARSTINNPNTRRLMLRAWVE